MRPSHVLGSEGRIIVLIHTQFAAVHYVWLARSEAFEMSDTQPVHHLLAIPYRRTAYVNAVRAYASKDFLRRRPRLHSLAATTGRS